MSKRWKTAVLRATNRWSEAIAVGSLPFVETVKNDLGVKAIHRKVVQADGTYALREPAEAYAGNFTAYKVSRPPLSEV